MTNEHSDTKLSRSSSSQDHNIFNQGPLVGNEDNSGDVVASPVHPTMDSTDNQINSIPATALVLGLGAAVLFLLLVVYVVVKVHFCKKQTSKKKISSLKSHETTKNSPTVSSVIQNRNTYSLNNDSQASNSVDTSQQSGLDIYRITSLGFSHQSSSEPTIMDDPTQARLTGARFLPGH